MASTALEEKINKIRLRNEEIKRRYEEVEADKKNAAKLDALVEPAPLEDWPERKEPPEFSAPVPKHTNKSKHSVRKHNDQMNQYYTGSGDGKKAHNFGDGQGPPPDPKYNFLADSEREEHGEEIPRDTERSIGRSKPTRGVFKRRGSGRDWHAKWNQHESPGDATRPDYEAWRAERNRIDEARISRQRTAEGNWRREWDNDKVDLADEVSKRENRVTLGDVVTRQEHSDNEKLYRSPRTVPGNSSARDSYHGSAVSEQNKNHGSVHEPEKRIVIATDRSIKVMLNPNSTPPRSSVMSVKVSPPNIAGTGRVGPRQRPRVMYSSQSDAEASTPHESSSFTRQKSVEEKIKGRPFDQTQKSTTMKSPHPQRRREGDAYLQRKDNDKVEGPLKSGKKDSQKSPYPQRRGNVPSNYPPKSPRVHRRSTAGVKNELPRDRNREKYNANSVSEDSKGEGSDGDVIVSGDSSVAKKHEKSNELLSHFDSIDKNNKSVSMNQSPPEESANVAELALESVLQSAENNLANENKKQFQPEASANYAVLESDDNFISLESSARPAQAVFQSEENNSANYTIKQSPIEISAKATQPGLESEENCVIDHGKENYDAVSEEPALESSTSPAEVIPYPAEYNLGRESREIHGEASGTQESTDSTLESHSPDTSSDDIDAESTSNQALINCSANSGVTSNDSGFLELPSNDSIHDVTGSVETSEFAETCMDSIVENSEVVPNVTNPTMGDIAEQSSNDLEKTAENSSTKIDSNALKPEGKNLETTEKAAEAANDVQESLNKSNSESAIDLENSDNIDQRIVVEAIDEKLQDGSINESSSVPKIPNDIGDGNTDEPAIPETLSSPATEKVEAVNKEIK